MPLSVVNAFICVALLFTYQLTVSIKERSSILKIIIYSVAAGVSLALLSYFRPIAIIFIIALFFYLFIMYYNTQVGINLLSVTTSLVVVCLVYSLGTAAYKGIVYHMTGYSTGNSAGWSLYVGSNAKTSGQWSSEDKAVQLQLSEKQQPTEIHSKLTEMAIQRIESYSMQQKAQLLINKATILGGMQKDGFGNLNSYPAIAHRSWVGTAVSIVAYGAILIIFLLALYFLVKIKKLEPNFVLYLTLVFIGLFLSSLLVEVNPRYFTPFIPLLLIMTIQLMENAKKIV